MEVPADAQRGIAVHVVLFLATCVTTVWFGYLSSGSWQGAVGFGATIMAILLSHEMGHYLVARGYRLDVSLPYFIPLPPQVSLGTLGAVIRMRQPIADRNQLIDVGAAGPLAGLAVAIPLLIVGLGRSSLQPIEPGGLLEGNSILYIGLKYLVFGRYLPADGMDVYLDPVAFAAWVGVLVTMINLIPIGQLDGGHVACAFLGERHERWSSWLHRGLLVVAAVVATAMVAEAMAAQQDVQGALLHGLRGGLPWLVWATILAVMRRLAGGAYHPPVTPTPLTPGRRRLVVAMALLFMTIVTPVPFRPVL